MFTIVIINIFIVAITVVIHYEFLYRISIIIPKLNIKHRFRIVVGVFGALIAHSIEIWIFGLAYYFINRSDDLGYLKGNYDGSILDSVYFSYTSYTTLGMGDIDPFGHVRHLVGLESLVGLLLITWTASFLYLEMQRYWEKR
ncbi:hypothetical protein MNBD_GAMMA21-672 [hydrothermal vent metagenome]|uniref:Potassium channel domain-containing protein n=1 Tax=hydrothermal vent metagenome TaxID=652676 RepID=A0A3B1A847_9ZZZZ